MDYLLDLGYGIRASHVVNELCLEMEIVMNTYLIQLATLSFKL